MVDYRIMVEMASKMRCRIPKFDCNWEDVQRADICFVKMCNSLIYIFGCLGYFPYNKVWEVVQKKVVQEVE